MFSLLSTAITSDNIQFDTNCASSLKLSTVAGTIGILIANSALNVIIGNENYNEMLVLDLQHNIIQRIAIKNDDN